MTARTSRFNAARGPEVVCFFFGSVGILAGFGSLHDVNAGRAIARGGMKLGGMCLKGNRPHESS